MLHSGSLKPTFQLCAMSEIHIRPTQLTDVESLRDAVNSVAAEKWFLGTVTGFTLEQTSEFVSLIVEKSLPQVVALDSDKVIGWCDILPGTMSGTAHVGRLGMGLLPKWRGQGLGRRLMQECFALARQAGIEKVELEVYGDNDSALKLYRSYGFKQEGLRARARRYESREQDIVMMALWI